MADMTAVEATIDGVAYSFRLLEADIATLTQASGNGVDSFAALLAAIGYTNENLQQTDFGFALSPLVEFSLFARLVDPKPVHNAQDVGDRNFVRPTGKTLLRRAAQLAADGVKPDRLLMRGILTLSLQGGGMALKPAAGASSVLAESNKTSASGAPYVASTLIPEILNAAAAA